MTSSGLQFRIDAGHPALAGHFPGHPVVPATMLLELVCQAVQALRPNSRIVGVGQAKFLSALGPDQDARIELKESGDRVDFNCFRDVERLAKGTIMLIDEG